MNDEIAQLRCTGPRIVSERTSVREAFEAWFRKERVGFKPSMLAEFEGNYVNELTQSVYCGWCGAVQWVASTGAITVTENEERTV